jgi:hypothetical protein
MNCIAVLIAGVLALVTSEVQTGMAAAPEEASPEGKETVISWPMGPDKRGKPQPPAKIACWLPARCEYVRGVVVAHPMIADLATGPRFRRAAADESLGMVVFAPMATSGKETIQRLDKLFDEWGQASNHPEIRGAAVFTGGLSASVLWSRNVAYGAPDRVFGTLHVAGGNLHQQMNDERKTLAGVPFIAMNGQFETCGPEGGIRPHLELETQWYLMGEQLLERRGADANNLMSLVVVPVKGHTAWNQALAALFLRKAAQYRLPKEKRDGSTPARCVAIRPEDGWLTDRDVKHPKLDPAPYAKYKGDKSEAFWHFDKEMALAVTQYHKDGIRPGQERTLFRPAGLLEVLWPLGTRMDIPFKGDTPAEHAATIREWIGKKTGADLNAVAVRCLAEGMAAGLKKDEKTATVDEAACRAICRSVCHAYDDAYRPIDEAIQQAKLAPETKDILRAHYAERMLVLAASRRLKPRLPIRAIQARIAALPASSQPAAVRAWLADNGAADRAALEKTYGVAPSPNSTEVEKFIADLQSKDAKAGWGAVEGAARLGAPVIPELVGMMEHGTPPGDFRAAAALGRLGKSAEAALPDLRRATWRGDMAAVQALQSIELIEKAGKQAP